MRRLPKTRDMISTLLAAILCSCSNNGGESKQSSGETDSISWQKGAGPCYWELPNPDHSTRLAAWILADLDMGTGTALAFLDSRKFPEVPIGDDLIVHLVADGDRSRSSMTRGFHPGGQGAYMVSAILGPSQREAIAGANEIALEFNGRVVAMVTANGFPTLDDLAACDRS